MIDSDAHHANGLICIKRLQTKILPTPPVSGRLALYNKIIFGTLFVAGELVVLGCWFRNRAQAQRTSFG